MPEENQEYVPMSDAYAPPKEEEKPTFTSDIRGIEQASEALEESRVAEKDIVERRYVEIGGEDHGKPVPKNQTIDLRRAVDDITRQRGFEAQVAEQQGAEALAQATDEYRAEQQQQRQPQQQQAQDVQPQPQISPDQLPPNIDLEVVTALQNNPKLRAAVEKEVIAADQSRMQYANATRAAAQVALASVLAQYPEIQGLSAEQLPIALQTMQAVNPQRAAEVSAHLQRAEQIYRLHQQAEGQNAAIMQAQLQHWSQQQDREVDAHLASESPEVVQSVKNNLLRVAKDHYGISEQDLKSAFAQNPILRSAPFQKMLYSLVRAHLAQENITDKKLRDAPPVQRPGVAGDRPSRDDAESSAAYRAFIKNPDPRSAAAFIAAKRSARR